MVFLARMLRASSDLNDYKIVLVNDRQGLEEQRSETAKLIGTRVNVIEIRADLRMQLCTDSSDVNKVASRLRQLLSSFIKKRGWYVFSSGSITLLPEWGCSRAKCW